MNKKKQKNFLNWARGDYRHGPKEQKFLRRFFKKRLLSYSNQEAAC